MSNWTVNNRSATSTWLTLKLLAQIPKDEVFKKAGSRRMDELLFWNKSSSEKIRKIQVEALSIMMDNVFRDMRGAKYEKGISSEKVINDIRETMLNSDNTVADLAEINDKNYLFWGEGHDQG
jgi:hypothetical protein